jgi:hypothetical protein
MRIAQSIFVGLITVVAAFASPARATGSNPNSHANANAQAADEAPASPGCHAYQKGKDGTWVEMACHEGIETAPAPAHGKSASHHRDRSNQTTTR